MKFEIDKDRYSFQDNWGELTINELLQYDDLEATVQKANKERKRLSDQMEGAEDWMDVAHLENEWYHKELEIANLCMRQMLLLCKQAKELHKALEQGDISLADLNPIQNMQTLKKSMGHLDDFIKGLKGIESFKAYDYIPEKRLLFFKKKTTFQVYPLSQQTLVRDFAAVHVAQTVWGHDAEFRIGNWENLALFCAYICRPHNELQEISLSDKDGFVGGKEYSALKYSDQMKFYVQKLDKVAGERAKAFRQLPLRIAFGIYNQYFFLKRQLVKNNKQLYSNGGIQTKESANYRKTFGMEANVEDLTTVSKHPQEKIWLYSVEEFHKEVLKFDMKIEAENKNREMAYELAKDKANAKRKP